MYGMRLTVYGISKGFTNGSSSDHHTPRVFMSHIGSSRDMRSGRAHDPPLPPFHPRYTTQKSNFPTKKMYSIMCALVLIGAQFVKAVAHVPPSTYSMKIGQR